MSKRPLLVSEQMDSHIKKALEKRQAQFAGWVNHPLFRLAEFVIMISPPLLVFFPTGHFVANHGPNVFSLGLPEYLQLLQYYLMCGCALALIKLIRIMQSTGPNEKHARDEWLWNNGKGLIFSFFMVILLYSLAAAIQSYLNDGIWFVEAGMVIAIVMCFLMIRLILAFPSLYFSSIANHVAMLCIFLGWPIWVVMSISGTAPGSLGEAAGYLYSAVFVIPGVIIYVLLLRQHMQHKEFSLVQRLVLHIIPPDKLLNAYQNLEEALIDEGVAEDIVRALKSRGLNGQLALLERLSSMNERRSKGKKPLVMLATLGFAVVMTVMQALSQDAFYRSWLKPLLCEQVPTFCSSPPTEPDN